MSRKHPHIAKKSIETTPKGLVTTPTLHRKHDEICSIVAKMYGVSPRYVHYVRNGERNNEDILASIMDLVEGKNALIKAVEQLVILPEKRKKRRKKARKTAENTPTLPLFND